MKKATIFFIIFLFCFPGKRVYQVYEKPFCINVPKRVWIQGIGVSKDSLGNVMSRFPFQFIWEEEDFLIDVRCPGGAPYLHMIKKDDSVWFAHYLSRMVVIMNPYQTHPFSGHPGSLFISTDLPLLFYIFPADFQRRIDSVIEEDSLIRVVTSDGLKLTFFEKDKRLLEFQKGDDTLTVTDWEKKGKNVVPVSYTFKKGVLEMYSFSTDLNITSYDVTKEIPKELWEFLAPPEFRRMDIRKSKN